MELIAKEGFVYALKKDLSICGKRITLSVNDSVNNWIEILEPNDGDEIELWHESLNVQIKMTHENNTRLLEQFPELAMYRKQNDINSYITDKYVYTYVNYLLDEHRYLLEKFSAIISTKE